MKKLDQKAKEKADTYKAKINGSAINGNTSNGDLSNGAKANSEAPAEQAKPSTQPPRPLETWNDLIGQRIEEAMRHGATDFIEKISERHREQIRVWANADHRHAGPADHVHEHGRGGAHQHQSGRTQPSADRRQAMAFWLPAGAVPRR